VILNLAIKHAAKAVIAQAKAPNNQEKFAQAIARLEEVLAAVGDDEIVEVTDDA